MIYGTVKFRWLDMDIVADLTDAGWSVDCPDPAAGRILAGSLDIVGSPAQFGPADGDPMAAAILEVARLMRGTHELAPLPPMPPGTIY